MVTALWRGISLHALHQGPLIRMSSLLFYIGKRPLECSSSIWLIKKDFLFKIETQAFSWRVHPPNKHIKMWLVFLMKGFQLSFLSLWSEIMNHSGPHIVLKEEEEHFNSSCKKLCTIIRRCSLLITRKWTSHQWHPDRNVIKTKK